MVIKGEQIRSITIDEMVYIFDGNIQKKGKRIQCYLKNKIGLHFIIRSEAYNNLGDIVPDYVAIYISRDERASDKYLEWWKATVQKLDI